MWITVPSSSRCQAIIGILHSTHTLKKKKAKQLTCNTFFLHRLSHNTAFEKIKIPKSLNPYSPNLNHPTQTQNKPTLSQVRQFLILLLKDTDTLLYFFLGLQCWTDKWRERIRWGICLGFLYLTGLNGNSFLFALPGSSLVISLMASARFVSKFYHCLSSWDFFIKCGHVVCFLFDFDCQFLFLFFFLSFF